MLYAVVLCTPPSCVCRAVEVPDVQSDMNYNMWLLLLVGFRHAVLLLKKCIKQVRV